MGESIKERIIQAALSDPFQSVEEIARRVGTTQQYVRTILSESGCSLMRLRREYVRNMERRLGDTPGELDLPLPAQEKLEIRKISAPRLAELLGVATDTALFQASRIVQKGGGRGLGQLVTALAVTLKPDCTELVGLLPVPAGELRVRRQWLAAVPSPAAMQELLGLGRNSLALRMGTLWEHQGRLVAVEFFWAPAEGSVLTWSGAAAEISLAAGEDAAFI